MSPLYTPWQSYHTTERLARSPLELPPQDRSVLDDRYDLSDLYALPHETQPRCPNCGLTLEWRNKLCECNFCCRVWDRDERAELVGNMDEKYLHRWGGNGDVIWAGCAFDVSYGVEAYQVDEILCDLVDIFWCQEFVRRGGELPLSHRDEVFCRFMYVVLEYFWYKPHQPLLNRLKRIQRKLRTVLPLVMFESTERLLDDLRKAGRRYKERKELDHDWWTKDQQKEALSHGNH